MPTIGSVVEKESFRRALRCFARGVAVVTVRDGDEVHGMTATAVCSLSLNPPLILVCVKKSTRTHKLIEKARNFAVNLLHDGQREIAERFAACSPDGAERFRDVAYHCESTGAPVLDNSLSFFDCRVAAAHDGGDHVIFLGRVDAADCTSDALPLIRHAGEYVGFHASVAGENHSAACACPQTQLVSATGDEDALVAGRIRQPQPRLHRAMPGPRPTRSRKIYSPEVEPR